METQASGWGSGWRLRLVGGEVGGIMSGTYVIGTAGGGVVGGAVEVCVINLFLLLQLTLLIPQPLTGLDTEWSESSPSVEVEDAKDFGRVWEDLVKVLCLPSCLWSE